MHDQVVVEIDLQHLKGLRPVIAVGIRVDVSLDLLCDGEVGPLALDAINIIDHDGTYLQTSPGGALDVVGFIMPARFYGDHGQN